mgnify:CR=1 FL=1
MLTQAITRDYIQYNYRKIDNSTSHSDDIPVLGRRIT